MRPSNSVARCRFPEQGGVRRRGRPDLDSTRTIGALVLGYHGFGRLSYAGRVGTGFTAETSHSIWKGLQGLRRKDGTFPERLPALTRKGVVWGQPELVADVADPLPAPR